MGKAFSILRAMVFVFILTLTLAFFPVQKGDFMSALIVSAGTFFLSVIVAFLLLQIFKHGD